MDLKSEADGAISYTFRPIGDSGHGCELLLQLTAAISCCSQARKPSAQDRWRAVNARHLGALVRVGTVFAMRCPGSKPRRPMSRKNPLIDG
jgi:hypothetical protein